MSARSPTAAHQTHRRLSTRGQKGPRFVRFQVVQTAMQRRACSISSLVPCIGSRAACPRPCSAPGRADCCRRHSCGRLQRSWARLCALVSTRRGASLRHGNCNGWFCANPFTQDPQHPLTGQVATRGSSTRVPDAHCCSCTASSRRPAALCCPLCCRYCCCLGRWSRCLSRCCLTAPRLSGSAMLRIAMSLSKALASGIVPELPSAAAACPGLTGTLGASRLWCRQKWHGWVAGTDICATRVALPLRLATQLRPASPSTLLPTVVARLCQ